jgi:hypothetical protein
MKQMIEFIVLSVAPNSFAPEYVAYELKSGGFYTFKKYVMLRSRQVPIPCIWFYWEGHVQDQGENSVRHPPGFLTAERAMTCYYLESNAGSRIHTESFK